jgi:hypothetical protein
MTMTKKDFLARFPLDSNQGVRFSINMSFAGLSRNTRGMDYINEIVDDFVEGGEQLMDIKYTPLRVIAGDLVVVRVEADASEFVSKEDEYAG